MRVAIGQLHLIQSHMHDLVLDRAQDGPGSKKLQVAPDLINAARLMLAHIPCDAYQHVRQIDRAKCAIAGLHKEMILYAKPGELI